MTREELIQSKEYVLGQMQVRLLDAIGEYMEENEFNQTKLANHLDVSKGYVSQVLHASYDHKLSKIVDLALQCDHIPLLFFVRKKPFVDTDSSDMQYSLMPVSRERYITLSTKDKDINNENNEASPVSKDYKPMINFDFPLSVVA